MRVLGYTFDKQLVAREFSPREIVDAGIDPWRLDLMDANPISYKSGEQELFFNRLQDVVFAYRAGNCLKLGFFDGKMAICFASDDLSDINYYHSNRICHFDFTLGRIKAESADFSQQFETYLSKLESLFKSGELGSSEVLPPFDADHLKLEGATALVKVIDPMSSCPVTFFGDMFAERALPMAFPKQLAWPLEFFAKGKPVLVGSALRNLLRGRPVDHVEVILHADTSTAADLVAGWYHSKPGAQMPTFGPTQLLEEAWAFEENGCLYSIGVLGKGTVSESLRTGNRYSVDGLYSMNRNEVRGTSIAFADIAASQARPISRRALVKHYSSLAHSRAWKARGRSAASVPDRLDRRSESEVLLEEGFTISPLTCGSNIL